MNDLPDLLWKSAFFSWPIVAVAFLLVGVFAAPERRVLRRRCLLMGLAQLGLYNVWSFGIFVYVPWLMFVCVAEVADSCRRTREPNGYFYDARLAIVVGALLVAFIATLLLWYPARDYFGSSWHGRLLFSLGDGTSHIKGGFQTVVLCVLAWQLVAGAFFAIVFLAPKKHTARRRRALYAGVAIEALAILPSPFVLLYVPWLVYMIVAELRASAVEKTWSLGARQLQTRLLLITGTGFIIVAVAVPLIGIAANCLMRT